MVWMSQSSNVDTTPLSTQYPVSDDNNPIDKTPESPFITPLLSSLDHRSQVEKQIASSNSIITENTKIIRKMPTALQENVTAVKNFNKTCSALNALQVTLSSQVNIVDKHKAQASRFVSNSVSQSFNDESAWLHHQIDSIQGILKTSGGWQDPDLIHPGDVIVLGNHPSWSDTAPVKPMYSKEQITSQLNLGIEEARKVATEDASINNPLRPLATGDPVSYAENKVRSIHANDPIYLEDSDYQKTLKDAITDVRVAYVKKLVEQKMQGKNPDINGALTIANSAILADPEHRSQIIQQSLSVRFTKEYFETNFQLLSDTPINAFIPLNQDSVMRGDKVADWLSNFSENAPAEIANVALDVVRSKLDLLLTAHNASTFTFGHGDKFFQALSKTIQAADSNGAQHAQEFAALLISAEKKSGFLEAITNTRVGMAIQDKGIAQAVGNGNSGLSTALVNALPGTLSTYPLPDLRQQILLQMTDGVRQLHKHTTDAVDEATNSAGDLNFSKQFVASNPEELAQLLRNSRNKDARAVKAANGNDDLVRTIGLWGERNAQLVMDLSKLKSDPDHLSTDEKGLFVEVKKTDDDIRINTAMQESAQLKVNALTGLNIDLGTQGLSNTLSQIGFVGFEGSASVARYFSKSMKIIIGHRFTNVTERIFNGTPNPNDHATFNATMRTIAGKLGLSDDVQRAMAARLAKLSIDIQAVGGNVAEKEALTKAGKADYFKIASTLDNPDAGIILKQSTPYNSRLAGAQFLRAIGGAAYAGAAWSEFEKAQSGEGNVILDSGMSAVYAVASISSTSELAVGLLNKSLYDFNVGETPVWSIGSKILGWVTIFPTAINGVDELTKGEYTEASLSAGIVGGGLVVLMASGIAVPIAGAAILVLAACKFGYKLYQRTEEANKYEFNDNPTVRAALSPLFSDSQLKQLLNSTRNGISPIVAWRQLADYKHIPQADILPYLRSLTPDQIKAIVKPTHQVLDDTFDQNQEKINVDRLRYLDEKMISMHVELHAQTPKQAPASPSQPSDSPYPEQLYIAKKGDSLESIGKKHHISMQEIWTNNPRFNPQWEDGDFYTHTLRHP